jgi:hypothetical protein
VLFSSFSFGSLCFRLFPMTMVGIPLRGNAAEGDDNSRVRVVSETDVCSGTSFDSGIELVKGALALLPRNVGATRFFPSFVIVIFCCNIWGPVSLSISAPSKNETYLMYLMLQQV